MKNKLVFFTLLAIIIFRIGVYLNTKFENQNKEEMIKVVFNDIVANKTGSEYIEELEGLNCDISKMINEKDGWKIEFEFLGSREETEKLISKIEKYEITTYDMMVIEGEVKLKAQLYCK